MSSPNDACTLSLQCPTHAALAPNKSSTVQAIICNDLGFFTPSLQYSTIGISKIECTVVVLSLSWDFHLQEKKKKAWTHWIRPLETNNLGEQVVWSPVSLDPICVEAPKNLLTTGYYNMGLLHVTLYCKAFFYGACCYLCPSMPSTGFRATVQAKPTWTSVPPLNPCIGLAGC